MKKEIEAEKRVYIKRSTLKVDPEIDDLNSIMRQNFAHLKRQLTRDLVEEKLLADKGQDWMDQLRREGLSVRASKDEPFRLNLVRHVAEISGLVYWQITEPLLFPEPTRKWIAKHTGITVKRLEGIDTELKTPHPSGKTTGGKPWRVDELVSIAHAMNVTVAYMLTPNKDLINVKTTLNIRGFERSPKISVRTSTWVLWLHNLVPLPRQLPSAFEKRLSFPSLSEEELSRNTPASYLEVITSIRDGHQGVWSHFKDIDNYAPLTPAQSVGLADTWHVEKRGPIDIERNLIYSANGLFVELRKLLKDSNLEDAGGTYLASFESGLGKVRNHLIWMVRYLRLRLSVAPKKTTTGMEKK